METTTTKITVIDEDGESSRSVARQLRSALRGVELTGDYAVQYLDSKLTIGLTDGGRVVITGEDQCCVSSGVTITEPLVPGQVATMYVVDDRSNDQADEIDMRLRLIAEDGETCLGQVRVVTKSGLCAFSGDITVEVTTAGGD